MWCSKCGQENPNDAVFCEKCGARLDVPAQGSIGDTKVLGETDKVEVDIEKTQILDDEGFDYDSILNKENDWEKQMLFAEEQKRAQEKELEEEQLRQEKRKRARRMAAIRAEQEKKKRRVIIIGLVVAAIIAVAGIAAFYFISRQFNGTNSTSEASSVSATVQLTPTPIETATPTPEATQEPTQEPTPTQETTATPTETPTEAPTEEPTPTPEQSGAITASVVGAADVDTAGYEICTVASATASSYITGNEGYDNSANSAVDGNEITSWQEDASADGTGGSLNITLTRQYGVRYIGFKLGNWRSSETYIQNNRPSMLTVWIGDVGFDVSFPDGQTEYMLSFSEDVAASQISVTVGGVYAGSAWNDTCISEITFYGK